MLFCIVVRSPPPLLFARHRCGLMSGLSEANPTRLRLSYSPRRSDEYLSSPLRAKQRLLEPDEPSPQLQQQQQHAQPPPQPQHQKLLHHQHHLKSPQPSSHSMQRFVRSQQFLEADSEAAFGHQRLIRSQQCLVSAAEDTFYQQPSPLLMHHHHHHHHQQPQNQSPHPLQHQHSRRLNRSTQRLSDVSRLSDDQRLSDGDVGQSASRQRLARSHSPSQQSLGQMTKTAANGIVQPEVRHISFYTDKLFSIWRLLRL